MHENVSGCSNCVKSPLPLSPMPRYVLTQYQELAAYAAGSPFSHRSRMRVRMTEVPDRPGRSRDHQHAEHDMRGHDMRVSREV